MKNRLQAYARHLRRQYRLFLAEYLAFFGLRQSQNPPPSEPGLSLPF